VRIRGTGCLNTGDFEEYFRASRSDPAVSPDMGRWIDFRGVTGFPSTEDIWRWVRALQASGSMPVSRVAVLVDSDLAMGVSMQFAGLTGMSERLQVFRDEHPAEAWLRSGELPSP
jgi:hypothetical protein